MKKTIILLACFCITMALHAQVKIYNIVEYGAVNNGITSNTSAIQKAINECSKNGGGLVLVPQGNFVTGSVQLFSNVNLYLAPGAKLLGSKDNNEYLRQKDFGFDGMGAGNKTGIVFAHNAENISITGQGIIDGRGNNSMYMDSLQYGMDLNNKYTRQGMDYMSPKFGTKDGPVLWKGLYEDRPGVMVIFSSCKNVLLSGVRFDESPNWTVAFLNCDNVKVQSTTINNNMDIPNSDGLDMYDSKNVTISDCVINAGDDAIAVVSSDNITVTNSVLHSRSCGVRIGYNVFNGRNSGNLLFSNIHIYDCNRGIGIFQRQKGDIENIIFSNIIIQTRLHTGQWWGHGEPIHISAVPGLGSKEVGKIKNVQFNNIIASGEEGILLYGTKESKLENISFNNVKLTMKNGVLTNSYGGNFDLRPTNDISIGIFKHDIPALYAGNIKGLSIKDFSVNWENSLPAFFTNAINCENFENIKIDGFTGSANAASAKQPAIALQSGKVALISNTAAMVNKQNVN